jgi:uncharacterized tellurite resistance protein B-like protein
MAANVSRQAKSTLIYEVRRQVLSMLYSVLGHGVAGRVATSVASSALQSVPTGSSTHTLSASEQAAGTVEAFRSVASQFVFASGRWVHRSAAGQVQGAMERQVAEAPVLGGYDRLLLARMLVEVAAAHGGISDEESSHLAEVLDPELGSLESLRERPPLTDAELGEASQGAVRDTMVAAVWALALCDEHEAEAEVITIRRFATALGVDADAAQRTARAFVLDQALERAFAYGGHDRAARQQLLALGERLGMRREEVELAEARYQKRSLG